MKVKKTFHIFVISFIFICLIGLGQSAIAEKKNRKPTAKFGDILDITEECRPRPLPVWPLSELKKEEKEARLRFFLDRFDWIADSFEKMGSEEQCAPLLSRLKSLDARIKILEKTNKEPNSPATCENLKDMSQYFNFSAEHVPALEPDRKSDANLSVLQKEEKYDFWHRPTVTNQTSYYDLSKYFGANSYGMLSDAAAAHFQPRYIQKFCLRGWDPYFRANTIVRVFNTDTCAAYFAPFGGAQRLQGDGDTAEAKASFTAFIEIDGKPFLLDFEGPKWNDFASVLSPDNHSHGIILIPLEDPNALITSVSAEKSCAYKADRTAEGYMRAIWKELKIDDYFEK